MKNVFVYLYIGLVWMANGLFFAFNIYLSAKLYVYLLSCYADVVPQWGSFLSIVSIVVIWLSLIAGLVAIINYRHEAILADSPPEAKRGPKPPTASLAGARGPRGSTAPVSAEELREARERMRKASATVV